MGSRKEADSDSEAASKEVGSEETKNYNDVFNGGYAWVNLVCVFCFNFCSWGSNSAFAVYFAYYSDNHLYKGANHITYAILGGLAFGSGAIFAPFLNILVNSISLKGTLMLGNVLQTAALILTSFSSRKHLWQLFLTQGVMQGFGLCLLGLVGFSILPHWFRNTNFSGHYRIQDRMLSFSQGISAAATGAGGLLFNLGMQKVLEVHGVAWALRVQAIINAAILTVAILLLKVKDSQKKKVDFKVFDMAVVKTSGFWLLALYAVFSLLGYVVTLYNLASFTITLGYTPYQGSIVSAMVQVGCIIGRPAVGFFSDIYGPATVTLVAYVLSAIFSLAMWIPARNYATVIVFALIIGSVMGSIFSTVGPLVFRMCGSNPQKVSVAIGMLFVFVASSAIASPIIGTSARKAKPGPDQYEYCALFVGLMFVGCSVCLSLLRGYFIAKEKRTFKDITPDQYLALPVSFREMIKYAYTKSSVII